MAEELPLLAGALRVKVFGATTFVVATGGTANSGPPVTNIHVLPTRTSSTMPEVAVVAERSNITKELTEVISGSVPRILAVSVGGVAAPKVAAPGLTQRK